METKLHLLGIFPELFTESVIVKNQCNNIYNMTQTSHSWSSATDTTSSKSVTQLCITTICICVQASAKAYWDITIMKYS